MKKTYAHFFVLLMVCLPLIFAKEYSGYYITKETEWMNHCKNEGLIQYFSEEIPQNIVEDLNMTLLSQSFNVYLLDESSGYRFKSIDPWATYIPNLYGYNFPNQFIIDIQDDPEEPKIVYCNNQDEYYNISREELIPHEKREFFYKLQTLVVVTGYKKVWGLFLDSDCDELETSYMGFLMDELYDALTDEEKLEHEIFPIHCRKKN